MGSRWVLFPLIMLVSVSVGCSSSSKSTKSSGQTLSGKDEQIFIGDTVEKNYDPNVIMKRAESFYDKEDYAEAIIEYQHFLDLHRVHTLASYAQFKLAESHFKQVKTVDRDINPIYKALDTYQKLQRDYPGSRYDGDAGERIQACHRMIAQSYLFVGQFYYRRDAYLAAAHRFEAILKQYPDMDIAGDALYYLALTYKEIGAEDWAREKLMAFTERYPNTIRLNGPKGVGRPECQTTDGGGRAGDHFLTGYDHEDSFRCTRRFFPRAGPRPITLPSDGAQTYS